MKHKFKDWNDQCSICDESHVALNQYGICADCWSKLSEVKRIAIHGEIERHIYHEVHPAIPLYQRVAVAIWRAAVTGLLAALYWRVLK